MPWLKIDDTQLEHEKFKALERLSTRMWADANALLLYIRIYCARNMTDGLIEVATALRLTPMPRRRALETIRVLEVARLLSPARSGTYLEVPNFVRHNRSREQTLAGRERKAVNQRAYNDRLKNEHEQNQTLKTKLTGQVTDNVTEHVTDNVTGHLTEHVTNHVSGHSPGHLPVSDPVTDRSPDPDPDLTKKEQQPGGRTALFSATEKTTPHHTARDLSDATGHKSSPPVVGEFARLEAFGESQGWPFNQLTRVKVRQKLQSLAPIPQSHLDTAAEIMRKRIEAGEKIQPGGWPYAVPILVELAQSAEDARNGSAPSVDTQSLTRGRYRASSRVEKKAGAHPGSDPSDFSNGIVEF